MSNKPLTDYTNAFINGMITSVKAEDLPASACTLARNIVLDDYTAAKRFGYSKVNSI